MPKPTAGFFFRKCDSNLSRCSDMAGLRAAFLEETCRLLLMLKSRSRLGSCAGGSVVVDGVG